MELCEHGEIADMLKAQQYFKEDDARKIIRDLASAISYLHKNGEFADKITAHPVWI